MQGIEAARPGNRKKEARLLQHNAPAWSHVAMTTATEYGFEIVPHPPYSPDMALSDFYLFPKLLIDLILYLPSTIFQLNRDGSSWVEPVLS